MNTIEELLFSALVFLLLPRDEIGYEATHECSTVCKTCSDVQHYQCGKDEILIHDSDSCGCCDTCKSLFTDIHLIKYHGVPEKLNCTGQITLPYKFKCDENGDFMSVQCSLYNCWCVDILTGFCISDKVPIKPEYLKTTTCGQLIALETGELKVLGDPMNEFPSTESLEHWWKYHGLISKYEAVIMSLYRHAPIKKQLGSKSGARRKGNLPQF